MFWAFLTDAAVRVQLRSGCVSFPSFFFCPPQERAGRHAVGEDDSNSAARGDILFFLFSIKAFCKSQS